MLKDSFVRSCLAAIVILLAIIAYRIGPTTAQAAEPPHYSFHKQGTPDPTLTAYLNSMAQSGWKLHTAAPTFYVWEK